MNKINKPFKFLNGLIELVPFQFEKKYNEIFNKKTGFKNLEDFSKKIKKSSIAIDLSQVRWVDFGAAAQLTLFIEWLLREKIDVTIFLPLRRLSNGENRHLEELMTSSYKLYNKKKQLFEVLVKGRKNAYKYLEHIGFSEAVKCDHLKENKAKLLIEKEHDFQSEKTRNRKKDNSFEFERHNIRIIERTCKYPIDIGYKRIIQLTWVDKNGRNSFSENRIENIQEILNNAEQGIEHIDARTITDVLLHELTKNLQEHAGSKVTHALIGGVLQTTNALNPDSYLDCEKEYFRWFKDSKQKYVVIFFGDTGAGLVTTLKKSKNIPTEININSNTDIIQWSFDKWSSCKDDEPVRGTKGLYRILRIINKYEGLATIRTEDKLAGYQKGGNVESLAIKNVRTISFFPGTFLRLHLVPFKELIKLNINPLSQKVSDRKKYFWKTIYKELNSNNDSEFSLSQKAIRDEILSYPMNKGIKGTINLFIILRISTSKIETPEKQKQILNKIFTNLSLVGHPSAIAIYIIGKPYEFSQGLIESEIDSFNSIRQLKKELDGENIFDPVLILYENRQFGWIGDEERYLLDILMKVYESESNSLDLMKLARELNYSEEQITKIKQFFNVEEALAYIGEDNQIFLRFNFKDLVNYYKRKLNNSISELSKSKRLSDEYYLTPNLKIIKNWIRINEDILNFEFQNSGDINKRPIQNRFGEIIGYAIALSIIMKDMIPDLPDNLSEFKILIDNLNCEVIAHEFALFNGIPKERIIKLYEEVDVKLPRRNSIFDEKDKVLIITSIISSKESIIRSIKTILRDSAKPVVVLSLVNTAKYDNYEQESIEYIWGHKIKIISLFIQPKGLDHVIEKEPFLKYYIEPFSHKIIEVEECKKLIEKNKLNLPMELINNCESLHFNHVGVENGRHFTFYLSAKRLLEHERNLQLIIDLYVTEIDNWLKKENIHKFEIWKISHEIKHSHPADIISQKIKEKFSEKCFNIFEIQKAVTFGDVRYLLPNEYNKSKASSNVIFIDWGTMTGKTIQEVINNATFTEKSNVLLCILFNQLPRSEGTFLSKINQTAGITLKRKIKDDKYDLFDFEQIEIKTNIKIKFLYDLPLYYYEQLECPICEHRQALRDFSILLPHMDDFFHKRRQILKIKDRKITDNKPVDFYGDDATHEFSSKTIIYMFEFNLLLRQALASTHYRNEILNKIKKNSTINIREFKKQRNNSESELYAILYFLSVEIMWLQKPPLSFKSLRDDLSEIALQIVLWDVNEMGLKKGFTNKVIVRYKFAAISVLRSSDKNKFIKNVSNIFDNSFINQNPSASLTQNLFYHIHSYLKRNYHQDKEQLSNIISGLNSIILKNPEKSIMHVAVYLKYLAEQRKSDLTLRDFSIYELTKSFIQQVKDSFNPKKDGDIERDHNSVFKLFYTEIFPINLIDLINDNIKSQDLSSDSSELIYKDYFVAWLNELQLIWDSLSKVYLNGVISSHLVKMRKILNLSTFDKYSDLTKMIDLIESKDIYFGYNDEFTIKYINKIVKDPKIILNELFYKNFIEKLNEYSRLFFYYNKENPCSSCQVLGFVNQFPTDLKSEIESCSSFRKKMLKENHNIKLVVDLISDKINNTLIFAPIDLIISLFDQIFYHNVIRHLKEQNDEINIKIELKTEDKNLVVDILTYGTYPNRESKGGLNKALEEIEIFNEGKYIINKYEDSEKRYRTSITFKIWE